MHLSKFRRKKKTDKKRKVPKSWQVDLGLVSKDEFEEKKRLKAEQDKNDREKDLLNQSQTNTFSSSSASAEGGAEKQETTWREIKKQVKLAKKLEEEQEKIEVWFRVSLGHA